MSRRLLAISGLLVFCFLLAAVAAFFGPQLGARVLPPKAPQKPEVEVAAGAIVLTGKVLVRLSPADAAQVAAGALPLQVAPGTESTPTVSATPSPEATVTPALFPGAGGTSTPEAETPTSEAPSAAPEVSPVAVEPTPAPTATPEGVAASRRRRVLAAASGRSLFAGLEDVVSGAEFVVPVRPSARGRLGTYGRTQVVPLDAPARDTAAPAARWVLVNLPAPEHAVSISSADGTDLAPADGVSGAAREALEQTADALDDLEQSGRFEKVEPVVLLEPDVFPNDPFFSSTGVRNHPYDDLWGLKRLQAPAAWEVTTGSASVTVAVIDTGVDLAHRDLRDHLGENAGETGTDAQGRDKKTNGIDDDANGYADDWRGWDFAENDNDPADAIGHGTHVAGTIGAVGNNGLDVTGVAWNVRILPLKIFPTSGGVRGLSPNAAAAILYAADQGARVANMSFGAYGRPQILTDALAYAAQRGVVLVASAGNEANDVGAQFRTPTSEPEVITVSAWTPHDTRATFSNYGSTIDLAAPGESILSLRGSGPYMYIGTPVSDTVSAASGTSMAAPHVSGAAALLVAAHPDWTRDAVRERLQATADDVGPTGRDADAGLGVVNLARALDRPALRARIDFPWVAGGNWAYEPGPHDVLEIRGTAAGGGFQAYRVEVGSGLAPTSWQLLAEQNTPVENGALASWPVGGVQPGYDTDVTFRLTVNPGSPGRIQLLRGIVLFPRRGVAVSAGEGRTLTPAVTLTMWTYHGDAEMRVRNKDAAWGVWEAVATTKMWTLPSGDGVKTVEVEIRGPGVAPVLVSDTITLGPGPLPPSAPTTAVSVPSAGPLSPPVLPAPNQRPGIAVPNTRYEVRRGETLRIPVSVQDPENDFTTLELGGGASGDFPGGALVDQ